MLAYSASDMRAMCVADLRRVAHRVGVPQKVDRSNRSKEALIAAVLLQAETRKAAGSCFSKWTKRSEASETAGVSHTSLLPGQELVTARLATNRAAPKDGWVVVQSN
jgi:hypothetical protein